MCLTGINGTSTDSKRTVGLDSYAKSAHRLDVIICLQHREGLSPQAIQRDNLRINRTKALPQPQLVQGSNLIQNRLAYLVYRGTDPTRPNQNKQRCRFSCNFWIKCRLPDIDSDACNDSVALSLAEDTRQFAAIGKNIIRPLQSHLAGRLVLSRCRHRPGNRKTDDQRQGGDLFGGQSPHRKDNAHHEVCPRRRKPFVIQPTAASRLVIGRIDIARRTRPGVQIG